MNLFWKLQGRRRFCVLTCLLLIIGVLYVTPAVGQSASNQTDDGHFTVYTTITGGSTISAFASDPEPDDLDFYASYEVLGEPTWILSGANYSDSGVGDSFGSGQVPAGSTYSASFYFNVVYYYYSYTEGGDPNCGIDDDGDYCQGFDTPTGYASIYIPPPPPQITSLSTYSVTQGDKGTLTITGTNLVENSGDQLSVNLSRNGGPFTPAGTPSATSATFTYDFTSYPVGSYTLTVTNNEAESDGVAFTVASPWPANACSVNASPKSAFSSFVSTGIAGSGTINVSFSGGSYTTLSTNVPYGPYSTPSSVASSIAAKISANYKLYGLTARAFGPYIVYSGKAIVGTVNHTITGPSIGIDTSSASSSSASTACAEAPPTPPAVCGGALSTRYVLAALKDTVIWGTYGAQTGRNITYSLELAPTAQHPNGTPPPDGDPAFHATVTEHLNVAMTYGKTTTGDVDGMFDDVIGVVQPNFQTGTYVADRCFTVTSGFGSNSLGASLGWIPSFDYAGGQRIRHSTDHFQVDITHTKSIVNEYTNNGDGITPKSVQLP